MKQIKNAQNIVLNHVYWAVGGGLIPYPLLDIAAVTGVQLNMLQQLSKLYKVSFDESQGKAFVTALAGGSLAKFAASFLKTIPGFGTILGGLSMSVVSGAATYAIGRVFIKHFEEGGTFENFVPGNFSMYYEEMFEEGKNVAGQAKKNNAQPNNAQTSEQDKVIEQLRQLGELKDKGIITNEDFEKIKTKLINSI